MSRVEKIADNVLALTDVVPIDGRLSWRPPKARGFEPCNKYVVLSDERAMLFDTGYAVHGESLIASLREVVGSRKLFIFITRIELECIGNLGRLLDTWPGTQVVTANVVPILGLVHPRVRDAHPAAIHLQMGDTLADFGFPEVLINQGPIRMLGTSWPYERRSRTLMTTDFFGCDALERAVDSPLRTTSDGRPAPDAIYETLRCKFDWLDIAVMDSLLRDWRALFGATKPAAIAPIHGRIQMGEALVRDVIEDYRRALFDRAPTGRDT